MSTSLVCPFVLFRLLVADSLADLANVILNDDASVNQHSLGFDIANAIKKPKSF